MSDISGGVKVGSCGAMRISWEPHEPQWVGTLACASSRVSGVKCLGPEHPGMFSPGAPRILFNPERRVSARPLQNNLGAPRDVLRAIPGSHWGLLGDSFLSSRQVLYLKTKRKTMICVLLKTVDRFDQKTMHAFCASARLGKLCRSHLKEKRKGERRKL